MKRMALIFLAVASRLMASDVSVLHLAPSANMERADLFYVSYVSTPCAVLVLSPGCNASGEDLARSPIWQEFARDNNLGLVGLSFASPIQHIHDGTGYYYASKGSGQKLLDGIYKIYGRDLPLLLYGFSGGAHFTSRVEEWKPDRVVTWCAYSAGWWDVPQQHASNPPGIIACGDADPRYGATLSYFKQGRAVGKPWLWISIAKTGHEYSPALDDLVRKYFAAILAGKSFSDLSPGYWADIDTKSLLSAQQAQAQPSLSAWLPSRQIYDDWKLLHEP